MKLLAKSAPAGAFAIDLEIESAERAPAAIESLRERTPVIVSYHNFESTPSLEPVLRRLLKVPADAYKIATLARKPTDSLRLDRVLKAASQDSADCLRDVGAGTLHARSVSRIRRPVHLCRTLGRRWNGARSDPGTVDEEPLPDRQANQGQPRLRRHRRPGGSFEVAANPQPRISGAHVSMPSICRFTSRKRSWATS